MPRRRTFKDITEIVPQERLMELNRKGISAPADYGQFVKDLFERSVAGERVDAVKVDGDSVMVETDRTIFELEVNTASKFFDHQFIEKFNSVVEEIDP